MNATLNPAHLRKAAVLIASLDRVTAERVLRQLGAEQATLVRQAAAELEDIDPAEEAAVIAEFKGAGAAPGKSNAGGLDGVELAGALASIDLNGAEPTSGALQGAAAPFRFLQDAEPRELAKLLAREHPQTAALIVAHLPPQRAAVVLAQAPVALRAELLRRLTNLDETPADIVREVEQSLESWMSEQSRVKRRKQAGTAALQAILAAADESTQHLLRTGFHADGIEAETIRNSGAEPLAIAIPVSAEVPPPAALRFDDLAMLDDAGFRLVLGAADPETLRLAIAGASPAWTARVTRGLSRAGRRELQKSLSQLGPLQLGDIDRAQRDVAAIADELFAAGRISIPDKLLGAAA